MVFLTKFDTIQLEEFSHSHTLGTPHCLCDFHNIRTLFCFQHSSILGSVFGDSYYDQQMTARQANALSHQVSKFISDFDYILAILRLK